jgi:hypothetical protein
MRKIIIAAGLALGVAAVSAPAAHAYARDVRPADCLVVVGGSTWIDGPCSFTSYGGGAFLVRGPGGAYSKVVPFGAGMADGGNIGTLYQRGACWVNDYAHVCAWQPGEPRWF